MNERKPAGYSHGELLDPTNSELPAQELSSPKPDAHPVGPEAIKHRQLVIDKLAQFGVEIANNKPAIDYIESLANRAESAEAKAAEALRKLEIEKLKNNIDEKTGAKSQNWYEQQLNSADGTAFFDLEFDPESSYNQLAIVVVDLDKFKQVNDRYGHSIGDQLLKRAVILLKAAFRSTDEVVRLGGDEFGVICKNTNNNDNFLEDIKSKMQSIVESNPILVPDKDNPSLIIELFLSYGVAIYDPTSDFDPELGRKSFNNTKHRADMEMYEDKSTKTTPKEFSFTSRTVRVNRDRRA